MRAVSGVANDRFGPTSLTQEVAARLRPLERGSMPVYLEPIVGDLFEEKTLAPEIIVAVDVVVAVASGPWENQRAA